MNNIATLLYAISALLGSSALVITAITKLWIAAARRKTAMQSQPAAQRMPRRWFDEVCANLGIFVTFFGFGGLVWMLHQPDGPATMHQVANAALCITNVVTGNLLLSTVTIKNYVA
jgi:hypothetical protein